MLVSMTGYGQGEASNRYGRVTAEVRTVNHRYLDLSVKMPRVLSSHEHEIKDLLKGSIHRGRITITVTAETELPEYTVKMNVPLMEQYVTKLRGFAKKQKLSSELDLNTVASLPEIFHLEEKGRDHDRLWPLVKKAMKQALDACNSMRVTEGKALETDLKKRITAIAKTTAQIEKRAPQISAHHAKMARERLGKLLNGMSIDDERFMVEAAMVADRMDFTEEVTRLKSHIVQMNACVKGGGAVSKKLTYLLQEVHREATTIGSKASDAKTIEYVVALKEEAERLREQVLNLE